MALGIENMGFLLFVIRNGDLSHGYWGSNIVSIPELLIHVA
jgi:hypothetical protein